MCVWAAGHVAGGALVGAGLGLLGSLLKPESLAAGTYLLAGVLLLGALHQLQILRLPLPHLPRQVPRHWIGRLPWDVVALGYGLQLGCAVATRIRLATTYAVLVCAVLSGSAASGAFIMGAFGAARGILPVLAGPRMTSPEQTLALSASLDAYSEPIAKINGLVLAATWFVVVIGLLG